MSIREFRHPTNLAGLERNVKMFQTFSGIEPGTGKAMFGDNPLKEFPVVGVPDFPGQLCSLDFECNYAPKWSYDTPEWCRQRDIPMRNLLTKACKIMRVTKLRVHIRVGGKGFSIGSATSHLEPFMVVVQMSSYRHGIVGEHCLKPLRNHTAGIFSMYEFNGPRLTFYPNDAQGSADHLDRYDNQARFDLLAKGICSYTGEELPTRLGKSLNWIAGHQDYRQRFVFCTKRKL
jgi:hypothetical protein